MPVVSALPPAFSLNIVALEAVRNRHICNRSPGNAGRSALPRRISYAGSYGRVGSGGYETVEDTGCLSGSTHLLQQRVELDLFITDPHTDTNQSGRTMLDSRYELWGTLLSFVLAGPARDFRTV